MLHNKTPRRRGQKTLPLLCVGLLVMMLVSACGSPQTQNQASINKGTLDKAIAHAQSIGIPATLLSPIIAQENKVQNTQEPISFFSSQPATDYYTNLAKNYKTLTVQVQGLIYQETQQLGTQAAANVKEFSSLLSQRQSQGFVEAKNFTPTLTTVQASMNTAKNPSQFLQISQASTQATESLNMLGTANDDLARLKTMIQTMQTSKLDTSSLNQQVAEDVEQFRVATKPGDFDKIIGQLNAQTQTANVMSTQAIPYLGAEQLSQFQASINSLRGYGGTVTSYQTMHDSDKQLLDAGNFVQFSTQITKDMNAIQLPLLSTEANQNVTQLMTEAKNWGHAHPYNDSYDGQTYDTAYDYWNGTVYDLQTDLSTASTTDDYQSIIASTAQQKQLFEAETLDAGDSTPADQPHQADIQLMKELGVMTGKVIVTSTYNGALRVYDNGKLVHSMLVVSGMPVKPTPPGFTTITNRQAPATFTSFETDKNSPFYYPATPIHYAMMYHDGQYYYHDSWWRASDDYGPGKQFPHYAPAAFNSGTHGCINMSLDEAAWLWNFTQTDATVYSIVY
jgi:L,D-transpeptidase catalytic domain